MKVNENEVYTIVSNIMEVSIENVKTIPKDKDLCLVGLSSIECVKIVVALENKFNFHLKDEDLMLDKLNSINKLFELLQKY